MEILLKDDLTKMALACAIETTGKAVSRANRMILKQTRSSDVSYQCTKELDDCLNSWRHFDISLHKRTRTHAARRT